MGLIPDKLPHRTRRFRQVSAAGPAIAVLYWHVDGTFLNAEGLSRRTLVSFCLDSSSMLAEKAAAGRSSRLRLTWIGRS